MKRLTLLSLLATIGFAASAQAMPNLIHITEPGGTYFKISTAQASSLPSSDKCQLAQGDVMEYTTISSVSAHFKITLPRAYPGCSLTTGYLYDPHVSTNTTTVTVHTDTVFKKSTAQSSTLPASDKCTMPKGVYKTSSTPTATSGHYSVNLADFLPNCGFSSGYIFDGHAAGGVQVMTLRDSAWIKTSTADSSTLPSSSKCLIGPASFILSADIDDQDDHYQVTLATTPSGCGFRSGYVYYFNTTYAQPSAGGGGGSYTWPMTGSDLGSAWCVCRNIGTSPHIGQDFVKFGSKEAVATNSGTVNSVTFSSSCGYILTMTDDSGASWRYVHLNNPLVNGGQRVSNGQKLADISAYPTSGCGTGPHLHLERRSAGGFGDSATGRSCQNGYRTCYYDPVKPWRIGGSAPPPPKTVQLAETPSMQYAAQYSLSQCKVNPEAYPGESASRLASYRDVTGQNVLQASVNTNEADGDFILSAHAELSLNPQNSCNLEAGGDCVVSWGLLAEKRDGSFARIFYDAAVRDVALERVYEEHYCAPLDATGRFDIIATTAEGEKYRVTTQAVF
ncbi:MAG: hypothetical protein Tsb002_30520 [Wenzhouxiangellaceae bacterium]